MAANQNKGAVQYEKNCRYRRRNGSDRDKRLQKDARRRCLRLQKIESGAVTGFEKVTNKCIEVLFAKDGESVEGAKARLAAMKDSKN